MAIQALFADSGTPLMWTGCCLLLFGNVLIGMFEWWLIRRRHGPSAYGRAWMIGANYASAFAGMGLLWLAQPLRDAATRAPFSYGRPFLIGLWLASFLVTVILEWPFVAMAGKLRMASWTSVFESLRVNCISYAILLPIFLFTGSTTAFTQLKLVEVSKIRTNPGWAYYLSLDGKSIWRVRLDGSRKEKVDDAPPIQDLDWTRVTIEPTSNNDRARLLVRGQDMAAEVNKRLGEAIQAAPMELRDQKGLALIGNLVFGGTRKFSKSPTVYCGYWSLEGIHIDGKGYTLETPVLAMSWRCPVVLLDGKVLAQFGDAIVLLDPRTQEVGELAEGTGPDVLLDEARPK